MTAGVGQGRGACWDLKAYVSPVLLTPDQDGSVIKKAKPMLQSLMASHNNRKRSEGELSHPGSDTHHCQDFTLDMEEL